MPSEQQHFEAARKFQPITMRYFVKLECVLLNPSWAKL
jgi:hypothetical protein